MPKINEELTKKFTEMADIIKNRGLVSQESFISVSEALTSADANIIMPKTIEVVMLDAAEPEYLASKFFRTVSLGEGRSMEFVNFGAIRAFEVGEGQELIGSSFVAQAA